MADINEVFKKHGIEPKTCKNNISIVDTSYKLEVTSYELGEDILASTDDEEQPTPLLGVSPSGLTPSSAAQQTESASRVARSAESQEERGAVFRSPPTPQITYVKASIARKSGTRIEINVDYRHDQIPGSGFIKVKFELTPRSDEFPKNIEDYTQWLPYRLCFDSAHGQRQKVQIGKAQERRKWSKSAYRGPRLKQHAMSFDTRDLTAKLWIWNQCIELDFEETDQKLYSHIAFYKQAVYEGSVDALTLQPRQ